MSKLKVANSIFIKPQAELIRLCLYGSPQIGQTCTVSRRALSLAARDALTS